MKYETREEFLNDYYLLKPHITRREHNQYAICEDVPYNVYTIAYDKLSYFILNDYENIQYEDCYDYCEFLDKCTLEEYLLKDVDDNLVATCYLRKYVNLVIDFESNEIYRDFEYMKDVSVERYLITTDKRILSI